MVISFSYVGQPYQVLPGRNALAGIYFVYVFEKTN